MHMPPTKDRPFEEVERRFYYGSVKN